MSVAQDKAEGVVKKKTKKKAPRGAGRLERRFVAQSANNPWLVRVLGGLGAATLGAGTWAYLYGHVFEADETLKAVPSYVIAAGALLTGATLWLGTSSDAPLRVGAPGISMERGEVRRMPWSAVDQITWEPKTLALVVTGSDESGASWDLKIPVKSHAEAVGWIMKEALDRIPKTVDIPDDVLEQLPGANPYAGMRIELEPLQVVGKKDALTGKTISYEPDARVCTRCERVYFKRSVPKKCKCGNALADLRGPLAADEDVPHDEDGEDDERREDAANERDDHETNENAREDAKARPRT